MSTDNHLGIAQRISVAFDEHPEKGASAVAELLAPAALHSYCLRNLTDAQIAHLFGERMTVIQNERDRLRAALGFIAEKAGDYHETELGVIFCNAEWCKEQARSAIA